MIAAVLALLTLFTLAACNASGEPLSNLTASTDTIVPGSRGIGNPPGVVEVRYTLGSPAEVSVRLQGPLSADLYSARQNAGEHIFRFTGTVPAAVPAGQYRLVRRVVPEGEYTLTVSAGGTERSARFHVSGTAAQPPTLENLLLRPETISPNSDAVDDVAELTFRTAQTSTISVSLTSPDGTRIIAFASQEKGPGEQNVVLSGQDRTGDSLPDGVYTVTVQLRDRAGNRVLAERPLTIQGGGEPSIEVLRVEISPQQIIIGNSIAVSVTVKNTGNVPLRSHGPDPGYTYTTNDSYSSIENNRWVDQAGLWRVGVDWDGNSGGAAYRYPFRWGFKPGGGTLMPGETVTTGGKIVILKQERRMWFFAGVLQEGIRIVRDRLGITPVNISF